MIIKLWERKLLRWLIGRVIDRVQFNGTTELYNLIRDEWKSHPQYNKYSQYNQPMIVDRDTLTCFNRTLRTGEAKLRSF